MPTLHFASRRNNTIAANNRRGRFQTGLYHVVETNGLQTDPSGHFEPSTRPKNPNPPSLDLQPALGIERDRFGQGIALGFEDPRC